MVEFALGYGYPGCLSYPRDVGCCPSVNRRLKVF